MKTKKEHLLDSLENRLLCLHNGTNCRDLIKMNVELKLINDIREEHEKEKHNGTKKSDEVVAEIKKTLDGIVLVRNNMNEYFETIFLNREKAEQYCKKLNKKEGYEDNYIQDCDIWGDR
jgi:hypothetical protein